MTKMWMQYWTHQHTLLLCSSLEVTINHTANIVPAVIEIVIRKVDRHHLVKQVSIVRYWAVMELPICEVTPWTMEDPGKQPGKEVVGKCRKLVRTTNMTMTKKTIRKSSSDSWEKLKSVWLPYILSDCQFWFYIRQERNRFWGRQADFKYRQKDMG